MIDPWDWPKYNPPGLLIGPVPSKRSPCGYWVPDYSHPGVGLRVRVEVDYVVDMDRYHD